MQRVKLVGEISKFGSTWETECKNIRDIFKLIECQTKGFRKHLLDAADAGIGYEIKRGQDYLEHEEELLLSLNEEDIIITEVPSGSKGGGKILAAIAIVAVVAATGGFAGAGIFGTAGTATTAAGLNTFGQLAIGLATNLAISGLSEMMAPGPETDTKQEEGYLFQGPQNNMQQGLPVPVCYGELLVGGAPMSTSFRPEISSHFGKSYGRKISPYAFGGYYNPYKSFLNQDVEVVMPTESSEFEVS